MVLSFDAVKTSVLCAKDLHRASKNYYFSSPEIICTSFPDAVYSEIHILFSFCGD